MKKFLLHKNFKGLAFVWLKQTGSSELTAGLPVYGRKKLAGFKILSRLHPPKDRETCERKFRF